MKTPIYALPLAALAFVSHAQPINLDYYSVEVENAVTVNSKHSEFGMVRSVQGEFVFTSDREKFDKRNQFLAESSYKMFTYNPQRESRNVRPMDVSYNADANNGPAAVVTNNEFYYTSTNKKATLNWREATMTHMLIIAKASLEDGKWKTEPVKAFKSKHHNFGQPALSPDGQTMYLISDMAGGYGGTDIYVSRLVDGEWTAPENLGPAINTEKNEMFPFLHESGALFFASEGHRGFGGLDIFMTSTREDGAWSRPENLGSPINTPADDFSVFFDSDFSNGFFASNRDGGMGGDDIYTLNLTPLGETAHAERTREPEAEAIPQPGAAVSASRFFTAYGGAGYGSDLNASRK